MILIKNIAKIMTLKEFNMRFEEERQGVRDRITNKMYYCPNDFGFHLTRTECDEGLKCKECWEYAKEHLKFNQKIKDIVS